MNSEWGSGWHLKATCANPGCGNRFEPRQRRHIYCSERCRWAVANTRSPVRREKRVPAALRDRSRPSFGASGPFPAPRALDDCPAEPCNRISTACNTTRLGVGSTPASIGAVKGTQRKSPPPRSGLQSLCENSAVIRLSGLRSLRTRSGT